MNGTRRSFTCPVPVPVPGHVRKASHTRSSHVLPPRPRRVDSQLPRSALALRLRCAVGRGCVVANFMTFEILRAAPACRNAREAGAGLVGDPGGCCGGGGAPARPADRDRVTAPPGSRRMRGRGRAADRISDSGVGKTHTG